MRIGPVVKTALVLAFLHIHFHHRFHGPPFDYVGLAVGSAISSAGFPGPGESLLIAAGILAAGGKLDLVSVLAVAWSAATVGGIAGWIAGLKAGRTVLSAPGPFRRLRLRALRRGDKIFERHPIFAVMLTPAWIAGIHGVPSRIYQPLNALSAALWAAGVGIGAYIVGPSIVDAVGDVSLATAILIGAVVLGSAVAAFIQNRRVRSRRATRAAPTAAADQTQASDRPSSRV